MILGYARLSRDDDKKKYVSIQNQKNIIQRYANEKGLVVDSIYEDDGVSGYTMDRPEFNEIKHMVDENRVDVLIVKDLSRLGRHNANVLLFLERLQAHNVRVILIDDNYDSAVDSDETIGIKTWYNEIYIKDGSKKVRNAMKIMQEKGELVMNVPFGYVKDMFRKDKYYVDPDAAIWVKKIFEIYANGGGYKKTAKTLNELHAPTPSMLLDKRRKERGLVSKIKVSTSWEATGVKSIIQNDFYVGTLRLRKSVRKAINGSQRMLPEEEQIVFENAHEPLVNIELFNLVQDINTSRRTSGNYKGMRKHNNPYAGFLICGDCGRALTIAHYRNGEIISYACRNYREKGSKYCSAHSINKKELNIIIKDYLLLCRGALKDMIDSLDSIITEEVRQDSGSDIRLKYLQRDIELAKQELKAIMSQKIKEIAANPTMADMISSTYDEIQKEKMKLIESIQGQIKEYENISKCKSEVKRNFKSALEVFDSILQTDQLTRKDIECIIDKILVYDDNVIEVKLRGDLSKIFKDEVVLRMSKEDRIKRVVINYISSVSSFGQMKLLNEIRKDDSITYEAILPLINEFIDKGYVIQTPKRHKADHPPYVCVASKEEMLRGFDICTDIDTIHRISNHSTDFRTIISISTWMQRYM